MGIIEFHFHDPEFDFSPSMTTGGEVGDDDAADAADTDDDGEIAGDWETDGSGGVGAGALVALVVLVALAVLAGLKRRSGGDESTDDADLELDA